jgi:hypothetical protein
MEVTIKVKGFKQVTLNLTKSQLAQLCKTYDFTLTPTKSKISSCGTSQELSQALKLILNK